MWFESLLVLKFYSNLTSHLRIRVVILIEINSALVSIRDLFKNVNVKSNVKFFLQLNFWTVEYFDCFPHKMNINGIKKKKKTLAHTDFHLWKNFEIFVFFFVASQRKESNRF